MTRRRIVVIGAVVAVLLTGTIVYAANRDGGELGKVRAATATYHQVERAEDDGWVEVEGLDHCFDNPGTGAMGFHRINPDLLDTEVDVEQPEALVYVPQGNGRLKLGAVEYIVPADAWEEAGHEQPPTAFGRVFHLNEELGVLVLHAWVFEHNPAGNFEDWNPRVSCPAGSG